MSLSSALALRTDRRGFIKHFALSTAVSTMGGKLWTARLLADVGPYGEPVGRIVVKVSDYPALANQFGAVRFRFLGLASETFPFSLNREDETTFHAVDTRCTHAGCMVNVYDSVAFAMVCDCHGSRYDIKGEVSQGPAVNNLLRYNTHFDGVDTVTVFIPLLDMSIRSVSVQERTGSTVRVRLQFPTTQYGRYRIFFREHLEDAPVAVLFATTPAGPATSSEIDADGFPLTVYVDAALPQGFFSVALVVEEY
jgi:Rieske Fe-S protein